MKRQLLLALLIGGLATFTSETAWAQGRFRRPDNSNLKEGQKAPNFKLKLLKGKKTVKLSSFKGKKPVVLIFGSYT